MALSNLASWNKLAAPASACGAGDNTASEGGAKEKPAACGSACGAGDK